MQLFWHLQLYELQIRELPALQPQKLKDVKPEFYDRNCTYFTSTGDFCNQRLLLSAALLLKMCLFCFYLQVPETSGQKCTGSSGGSKGQGLHHRHRRNGQPLGPY